MRPAQVVLMVVAIVGGVALIQAAVWIPIVRKLRRLPAEVQADLEARGEKIVIPAGRGQYRGGTGHFPKVAGLGVVALTRQVLCFRRLGGKTIEIPVGEIASVRADRWFRRAAAGGRIDVFVKSTSGDEVAFSVANHAYWKSEIERLVGERG
jgi:hypothetical protein